MRIVRRLYIYVVAFISLEVVIWGLIGLVRSMVGDQILGSGVERLASAISLIAVGLPFFLLHWWLAQRSIGQDDERFSTIRAVFLYGVLLVTLVPIAQNVLGFLNRILLQTFGLPARLAFIGVGQSWIDNGIAVVINGVIGWYIFSVLRKDRAVLTQGAQVKKDSHHGIRRLNRYLWVIYGLAMVVGGVQQVLVTILTIPELIGDGMSANLANGLALLLVGTPIWVYAWRIVQASLDEEDERQAVLRLVVLFALSLVGVGGVLIPLGMLLNVVFLAILGDFTSIGALLTQMSNPLSALFPFAGVWWYYEWIMKKNLSDLRDPQKQAGVRRLYVHILSFAGLAVSFLGLNALLLFVIDTLLPTIHRIEGFRERLSIALSMLVVGVPLWLIAWRSIVLEASYENEQGDHARRSLVRKVYLYITIFISVIGVMASAGSLIYQVMRVILGEPPDNFQRAAWVLLELLVVFTLVLVYHWVTLRGDGRLAEKELASLHEAYPVLILVNEIGDFSEEMMKALQRTLPSLPVVVHMAGNGVPDGTLSEARAVILSGDVATQPNEAIRLWINNFPGIRLVVPTPTEGWRWIFGSGRSLTSLAHQTAKIIRHLSEGSEVPGVRDTPGWMIFVYILAGIVGIPILIGLLAALGELIF